MFDDYIRWHIPLLVSLCGQHCTDTEVLPLIKVSGWVLVCVRCNYTWLIIETCVSRAKPSTKFHRYKQLYVRGPTLAAAGTFHSSPKEISYEPLSSCFVTDTNNKPCWQKSASSKEIYQASCCPMFFGDLTLFTQQSVPQRCPISCMTHWMADLWVFVREGAEYPAITGRAPKIKSAPADCVSQCESTGKRLHYPLGFGNTDSTENPPPLPQSPPLHTAHI